MFWKLAQDFQDGELEASPTVAYAMESAAEAFKHLARANHIGKVVLKLRNDPDASHISYREFTRRFGEGIDDQSGIETLRLLLSSDITPPFVLATAAEVSEVKARRKSADQISIKGPSPDQLGSEYAPPNNEQEQRLAQIWEEILGVSPIGIDDDFIRLGGDSISAIRIQFAVEKAFGRNLSMSVLFQHPTIRKLTSLMSIPES